MRKYLRESDGWYSEDLDTLKSILDDIYNLQYEINSCVKGAYTGCESYEALSEYVKSLGQELIDCADYIKYLHDEDDDETMLEHSNAGYKLESYTGALEYIYDLFDCRTFDCLNRKLDELFMDTDIYEGCREISDKYRDKCGYSYKTLNKDDTYYVSADDFECDFVDDAVNEIFNTYFN